MSKAQTLANLVSTGSVLADGTIDAAEIGNLTLPAGGDIVGTTSTQTLTNKTIASPTLTGTPVAPTAAVGTDTTQIATTAFVNAEIANDAPSKTGTGASGTWGISVTGNSGTATVLQTGRTVQTNLSSTTAVSFNGSANITPGVTGTLPVARGGTGSTTLAANNVLLGNGTGALQVVAPGTSGNVLTSNGTTWTSTPAGGGAGAFVAFSSTDNF